MNILEMSDYEIRQQFSEYCNLSMTRDQINVTSNHRPNIAWKFVDSAGHEHRWFVGDGDELRSAIAYHPQASYTVPSIEWIKTGIGLYEDGSEYDTGIYVCKECREEVTPGYTADHIEQYIPGMTHYYLDGKEISKNEATRLLSILFPGESFAL